MRYKNLMAAVSAGLITVCMARGQSATPATPPPDANPPMAPAATAPSNPPSPGTTPVTTDTTASAAPAPDNGSPMVLENLVVTAEKREASVQDTPISMEVDSGGDLMSRGISDFATLAAATPGVSIKDNGPGQTEFEMRGMTSMGGNSPTVGFYFDDIPLTSPANAQNGKVVLAPPMFDINNTEFLRGPQGTLYGSGSMGGTVKIITNQPDLSGFQGSAQSTLGGTEYGSFNHADNIMLNIPVITDKLGVRIVATEAFTSGWIDRIVETPFPLVDPTGAIRGNVLTGPDQQKFPDSNSDQYDSVRGIILFKPSRQLSIKFTADYLGDNQTGIGAFDSTPGNLAHYEVFNIPEPKTDKEIVTALNVDYTFDAFDATLITGYWARRSTQVEEASEMFDNPAQGLTYAANYGLPNPGYYGPTGTGEAYGYEDDPSHQFSSELRFASTDKGPLQWVGGAYFTHFWGTWNFTGTTPNYATYMDIGTGNAATSPNWFDAYSPTTLEQYALFANATYALTSSLKASVGLRWNDYAYGYESSIGGWGSALGEATPSVNAGITQSASIVDPKFNLTYTFSNNLMMYATAAEGFRPGGGNPAYPTTGVWAGIFASENYTSGKWPSTYKSDSVWSYEYGLKSRFLDRHLQVNASVYYEDWKDIQLLAYPDDWNLNINGNHATIYGADIDVRGILGGGFEAGATAGYLHDSLNGGPHWVIAPTNVLPDVAQENGNAYLSYSATVFQKYKFKAHLEYSYVGPRYSLGFLYYPGYVENGTYNRLPGYELTSLRVGIDSPGDVWGVALFANNLFNTKADLENLYSETQPSAAFNRVVSNQPFTWGVDLTYRF